MQFRLFFISFLALIILGCATTQTITQPTENLPVNTLCNNEANRNPATYSCSDLFQSKIHVKIVNDHSEENTNKIKATTVTLIEEVLPQSTNEAFWKLVEQLAQNSDSTIASSISTGQVTLTQAINSNLKLHNIYIYNTPTNEFILNRIEYTIKNQSTKLLTDEPLNNKLDLKPDLLLNIPEFNDKSANYNVNISASIPYKIYEKVKKESKKLELFTTHELYNLSKLEPKKRIAKYNSLLMGRKIRNFITEDFFNELIKKPIRTVVISVLSIVVLSHTDFLNNVVSVKSETPEWVAPSIVKMAGRYPARTQSEIVLLMKTIEAMNKEKRVDFFKNEIDRKKSAVKIDEVDQFTIHHDSVNKKTYFMLTHEAENGTIQVYSVEIDANRFPQLIKQASAPRLTQEERQELTKPSPIQNDHPVDIKDRLSSISE